METVDRLRALLEQRRNRAEIYSRSDYWDRKAQELDGSAVSMWRNRHLNELYHAEQTALIEALAPDVAGLDVLDVGCGTGRMSAYFANRGAKVVGVDFASSAIEIARRDHAAATIDYRVGSVFELPFEAEFDLAISWGTLTIASRTHADLAVALERIRAALRPGGRALLLEPVHDSFLHRVLRISEREFLAAMSAAGFDVLEVRHMHFWPARLALAFIEWPRSVTRAAYAAGDGVMGAIFRRRRFGDYQMFHAARTGT